jgi:hypothetical protein
LSATADFGNGRIDEASYEGRLKERRHYVIRQTAGPDEEGHLRVRCPASNPKPVSRCDLKPESVRPETRGRLRVNVRPEVEQHPPSICSQQSLTLPPEAGAKFAQDPLYGSEEWHATYSTLRNSIEGFNGYVKDGAREALDDSERRRVRGVAAERVFVALLLAAANLRKIATFIQEQAAIEAGTLRRLPRRRITKALGEWLPEAPKVESGSDPDPPMIA